MTSKTTKTRRKFRLVLIQDLTPSMGLRRAMVRREGAALVQQLFTVLPQGQCSAGVMSIYDMHREGGRDFRELLPTADWRNAVRCIAAAPDGHEETSADACYERALHRLLDKEWQPPADTAEAVVLIGDAAPHYRWDAGNPDHFDWKHDAQLVAKRGAVIHPVFVNTGNGCDAFWQDLAEIGNGGFLFELGQSDLLATFLLGSAARAGGGFPGFKRTPRDTASYASQRAMDRR